MNRASSKLPSFCFSDAKGLEIRLHSRHRVEVNRRSSLVERSSSMRGIEACQKKNYGPKASIFQRREEQNHQASTVESIQVRTQLAKKRL